jgi:hypothetical protein
MILQWIFNLIAIYLLAGLVFSVAFILKGIGRIDEGAQHASIGFKLIIIPGTMVFWPLLFKKWWNAVKNVVHD